MLDKKPKGKFDARAKEGILVGYSEVSKGYRVWLPSESRVAAARDVKFDLEVRSAGSKNENADVGDFIGPRWFPKIRGLRKRRLRR